MTSYPVRDIASHHRSRDVPAELLQSIFAAELIDPGGVLWIVSPWISDIELINNEGGRFSAINPDWPNAPIRLVEVLSTLVTRGGAVTIVTTDDPHNDELERKLDAEGLDAIRLLRRPALHMKGIIGRGFALEGSMNLTYNGVHRNEERLIYRTDPAKVSEIRIEFEQRWGAAP
jgi:hypothetical protein